MASREKFLSCPQCTKRGVYRKSVSDGDGYSCRYCGFWTYYGRLDSIDRAYLYALQVVNSGTEIIDAPSEKPGWPDYLNEPDEWLKGFIS